MGGGGGYTLWIYLLPLICKPPNGYRGQSYTRCIALQKITWRVESEYLDINVYINIGMDKGTYKWYHKSFLFL